MQWTIQKDTRVDSCTALQWNPHLMFSDFLFNFKDLFNWPSVNKHDMKLSPLQGFLAVVFISIAEIEKL